MPGRAGRAGRLLLWLECCYTSVPCDRAATQRALAVHRSQLQRHLIPSMPLHLAQMQRRLTEIERLEAKAATILEEVAQRTGVGAAAEALWAK